MYQNEEHKRGVIERGDGYEYIGSYKLNEVTIDGKNKKHNATYIRVKCPYCRSEYDVALSSFVGKLKTKCTNCCNTYENSFAYYIEKELNEKLEDYWDFEENGRRGINPYCVTKHNSSIKISIWCKNKWYHGSYFTTTSHFTENKRCPYCANQKVHPLDSFGQYLINTYGKDAIKKYWSDKNINSPFKISKGSGKPIYLYCQDKDYHNDYGGYSVVPYQFMRGDRCPYCTHKSGKVHPKDSFGNLYPEKAKYWSPNNKKSPFEVTSRSGKKYKFICEKCGEEFERDLANLNRNNIGIVCKKCNSSQLETKTKNILEKHNIKYEIEKSFFNLYGVGGKLLRFDFYLSDYNLLIECQGTQHKSWQKTWVTKEDFERQLEHDKRKKQYAKENNIDLLEIWYYDIDNIENILMHRLNLNKNN
jgi:hypothetical protein